MTEIPDVLQRIRAVKRQEISELTPGARCALESAAEQQPPARGFRDALLGKDSVALIAELKKASPSAGLIRPDFDPVRIARTYQSAGATCISVLTDRHFFQGETTHLSRVRQAVNVPLLRKDFILDSVQVLEARALGADACLLIVAALQAGELLDLLSHVNAFGMDALVEVHTEEELHVALEAGADLVGVNNRDLHSFEVDLGTTERLAPLLPDDVALVAESGIRARTDVERLKAAGADAVLVGETLMRANDIAASVRGLVGI